MEQDTPLPGNWLSGGGSIVANWNPREFETVVCVNGDSFRWSPKEDITPYELAQNFTFLMPAFVGSYANLEARWDAMTEGARKHWAPVTEAGK